VIVWLKPAPAHTQSVPLRHTDGSFLNRQAKKRVSRDDFKLAKLAQMLIAVTSMTRILLPNLGGIKG
jgi:hypothetical protein